MAMKITTGKELAQAALNVANHYKTLYVNGCFGAPMTESNKLRYCNNTAYNKAADRTAMIKAAGADTFGFDCVGLVKGLLWGWSGDTSQVYGGAVYASNGLWDIDENTMIAKCSDISADFSGIEAGEAVWMPGHIGIYTGGGLAVECSPAWKNGVQVTACNCAISGYERRNWTKHGKLPWIDYTVKKEDNDMVYYKNYKDVPSDYQAAVKKCMDKGALKGTGGGEINVSEDFCRTMTVLDRLGKLD